jgi:hypothetical protein
MSTGATAGYLYVLVHTATNDLSIYRSVDLGANWTLFSSFTHTGLQEWSSLVVDKNGYAHIAYRINASSLDTIYYRRCSLTSGSWSSAQETSVSTNGGVAGAGMQGMDLAVVRNSSGAYYIAVCIAQTLGTHGYGLEVCGITISTGGSIDLNNGIISNNREWHLHGTAPGRSGVSCEIEHNGDGFTSSTPHLWVSYGRTALNMVKLSWQGSGWSGPSSYQVIRTTVPTQEYAGGRWDGSQWLMPVINPDDITMVRVYQRNQANTLTSLFDTPTHTTGNIRQFSVGYDNVTKDIRVYAVGTSTAVLYFVDYDRSAATWGSWATVSATAVLTSGAEWGVRRGGNAGNSRLDVITCHSGSPNTVVHTAQTIVTAPAIPTWDTSAVPYVNGGAADVSVTLLLDWTFDDPGDTQGSYAVSRQIGAGSLTYWRASDSTWQASEVQNSSATSSLTLPTSWAAGTDAIHTFKAKVWDAGGLPSGAYSDGLLLVPSTKVNPTVTAPTAAQVIGVDQITVTWTVSEQTQRRIRLLTNPGAAQVYDSGFEVTTALTLTVPTKLNNGTGWTVELTTKNNEGLDSTTQSVNFTVAYAAPPAPISVLTPLPLSGYMLVTPSVLAPVGAQPAIASMSLYRRPRTLAVANANPDMNGDIGGWAYQGGGSAGTLSYSTVQFRSSPGALRYVPHATGVAVPQVESAAFTQIVAGSSFHASAWIRPDTSSKPLRVYINAYSSGGTLLGAAFTEVAAVATAWQYIEIVADPLVIASTATQVKVAVAESATPAAADAFYADDIELVVYDTNSSGIRVAVNVASTTAIQDWQTESLIDHEYRWVAIGSNGTSITGPWTA